MLQHEQTIENLDKCVKKRAVKAFAWGLAHITWQKDNSYFEQVFQSIKHALETKEAERLLPFLYVFEVLVSNAPDYSKKSDDEVVKQRQENFVQLMELLITNIKQQSTFFFIFMTLVDFLLKLATRYPICGKWICEHKDLKRIRDFVAQNTIPPSPAYGQRPAQNSMRLFRKHLTVNDYNYYPQYINHYKPKLQALGDWRTKLLDELVKSKKAPDLSGEPDPLLMDVLDFKFICGAEVEQRQELEAFNMFTIVDVLDEMIMVRGAGENAVSEWISCYSDKLLPLGAHTKTHRSMFVEQQFVLHARNHPVSVNPNDDTLANEEEMEDESDSH